MNDDSQQNLQVQTLQSQLFPARADGHLCIRVGRKLEIMGGSLQRVLRICCRESGSSWLE